MTTNSLSPCLRSGVTDMESKLLAIADRLRSQADTLKLLSRIDVHRQRNLEAYLQLEADNISRTVERYLGVRA
jgi:hypothetical protein